MRRAMLWGFVLCLSLVLCSVVFAEEKPAGEQSQAGQSQAGQAARPTGRVQNLSPEERAKLREKWATMSDEERAQARAKLRERLSGGRPVPDSGSSQSIADQIVALRQEHQATTNELKAIRQLATKEKATETGKALDGLIARHEQTYQRRLQQLEQRQQRIEAVQKGTTKGTPKTDPNSPTGATQKQLKGTGRVRQK